ncbi:MAG: hypothetical protein RIF36_22185 [Imperialibacter sp.]|uniref:hypothetical protein n=1 Tax=Imperialibacter sp. TaxID=2038411 RepID=UPI0032EF9F8B
MSLKKNEVLAYLRLFLDFVFIFIVVLDKDVSNVIVFVLIILPVINNPNFSGRRASPFKVVLLSFLTILFELYRTVESSNLLHEVLNFTLVIVIIGLIIIFENLRYRIVNLIFNLSSLIDKFYISSNSFENTDNSIREILKTLNKSRLLSFSVSRLSCFRVDNDRGLLFECGSSFLVSFTVNSFDDLMIQLQDSNVCRNGKMSFNGEIVGENILFLIEATSQKYLFVVEYSGLYLSSLYETILEIIFMKFTKLLDLKYELAMVKRDYLESVKNKVEFVEEAQMAMHFIKNKLGPLRNFMEILGDYLVSPTAEKKVIFEQERAKIGYFFKLSIDKASNFQNGVSGPFNREYGSEVGCSKLIEILRAGWFHYFNGGNLSVQVSHEEIKNYKVFLNEDGLDFLFTNWISNMSKYKFNYSSASLEDDGNFVKLSFVNDYAPQNHQTLIHFIDNLTAKNLAEISNRKLNSRGWKDLRYLLSSMELSYDIGIQDRKISFELKFPKIY